MWVKSGRSGRASPTSNLEDLVPVNFALPESDPKQIPIEPARVHQCQSLTIAGFLGSPCLSAQPRVGLHRATQMLATNIADKESKSPSRGLLRRRKGLFLGGSKLDFRVQKRVASVATK